MILGRQLRRQQRHRRQRDGPVGEQVQDHWKPPGGAGGLDTAVGRVLRQMQHLRAVDEERGISFAEIQAPRIQLHQQRDHLCGRLPLVCHDPLRFGEQRVIGQVRQGNVHDSPVYHRLFLGLWCLHPARPGVETPSDSAVHQRVAQAPSWPSPRGMYNRFRTFPRPT